MRARHSGVHPTDLPRPYLRSLTTTPSALSRPSPLCSIGCKNCNHCAANTFRMEEEYGRARVFAQWADTEEDIQTAIDSCPVDCIHWCGALLLCP